MSYRVTTASLLTALEENGQGALHNVDRPPLTAPDRSRTGALVPEVLKHRWTLHAGPSRDLLPGVLEGVEGMSLFVHDSLRTHRNMTFELEQAQAALSTPGVILVDDVDDNHAFAE